MRIIINVLVVMWAIASPAAAQQRSYQQLREDCVQDADAALQIAGCNAVIANPEEGVEARSMAASNRGHARERRGDVAGAMADYEWAITVNSNNANARYNRAKLLAAAGQLDRALEEYNRAIAIDGQPAGHYERALVQVRRRDFTRAVADFDVALRASPRDAQALSARGAAQAERGDHRRALLDFEAALAIEPTRTEAIDGRVRARAALALSGQTVSPPPSGRRLMALPSGEALIPFTRQVMGPALGTNIPLSNTATPRVLRAATREPGLPALTIAWAESPSRIEHTIMVASFEQGVNGQCQDRRMIADTVQGSVHFKAYTARCPGHSLQLWMIVGHDEDRTQLLALAAPVAHAEGVLGRGQRLLEHLGIPALAAASTQPARTAEGTPPAVAPAPGPPPRACDQAGSQLNLQRGRASGVVGESGADAGGPFLLVDAAWWRSIPHMQRQDLADIVHCAEGRWGAQNTLRVLDKGSRLEIGAFTGPIYRDGPPRAAAPTAPVALATAPTAAPIDLAETWILWTEHGGVASELRRDRLRRLSPTALRYDVEATLFSGRPGFLVIEAPSCANVTISSFASTPTTTLEWREHLDFDRLRALLTRQGEDITARAGSYGRRLFVSQDASTREIGLNIVAETVGPRSNNHELYDIYLKIVEQACPAATSAAPTRDIVQLRADCGDPTDATRQIAGCEAVLANPTEANNHAIALNNRGHARERSGEIAAALADYERAITRDTTYATAQVNRGRMLARLGRADEALAAFDRVIQSDDSGWARLERGRLLASRNERERALADLDRAVQLLPADEDARRARDWARVRRYQGFDFNEFPAPITTLPEALLNIEGFYGMLLAQDATRIRRDGQKQASIDWQSMPSTGEPGRWEVEARGCAEVIVSEVVQRNGQRHVMEQRIIDLDRLRGLIGQEGDVFSYRAGVYGERITATTRGPLRVRIETTPGDVAAHDQRYPLAMAHLDAIKRFCPRNGASAGVTAQVQAAPPATPSPVPQAPATPPPARIETARGLMRDKPFSLSYPGEFQRTADAGSELFLDHPQALFQVSLKITPAAEGASAQSAARGPATQVAATDRAAFADFSLEQRSLVVLPAGPAHLYVATMTSPMGNRPRLRMVVAEVFSEGRRYELTFTMADDVFASAGTAVGFMLANFAPTIAVRQCCAEPVALPW